MDKDRAAAIIQAHFKGFLTRRDYARQKAAASTIQGHALRFLDKRQAARDEEQQERAARFRAVMSRHRERIQSLEHEKRLIQGLPLEELDALQARRHAAATTIQAHWRGAQQRQQLRLTIPAMGLRPITCSSPQLPDDPSGLLPTSSSRVSCHPHPQPRNPNLIRSMMQQELQQERSAASMHGHAGQASTAVAGGGLASSASKWAVVPCAEESSWLSAEGSRLSAAGGADPEQLCGNQRRTATIPAANRALLDRQVKVRVDAVSADPSTLRAMQGRQQQTDQHLAKLLQEHSCMEGKRLQAVRRRQRLLQKADMLHAQLKLLPQLDALSDSAWPAQYSLPRPGSIRAERAQQAHAMSLGEARVNSKWWGPLKQLNQMYGAWATAQHAAVLDGRGGEGGEGAPADGAGFLRMQREWQQEEAAWRSGWAHIQEQLEQQRP